jgi:hypothetical protein
VPRERESESEGEGDRVTEGGGRQGEMENGKDDADLERTRARESKRVTRARRPATRTVLTWPVCVFAHTCMLCRTHRSGHNCSAHYCNVANTRSFVSSTFSVLLHSVRNPMRARAGVSSTTESQGIQAPQMQTGQGRSPSPPPLTHSLHGPGNGRVDSQHPSGAQAARGSASRTGAVSVSASSTTPSSDQRFFHF